MKCAHKKDGKNCGANSQIGSKYCFVHDPDKKNEHIEASRKGGSVKFESGLMPLEPVDLTNPKAVLYVLTDTINRVRKVDSDGSMGIKTANCIGHLASKMIEAQKLISLDARLARLEKSINVGGGRYDA